MGVTKWDKQNRTKKLIEIDEALYLSDRTVDTYRLNFTLGHEYFHAIEHWELAKQQCRGNPRLNRLVIVEHGNGGVTKKKLKTNEDWQEWQANEFSAEILVPRWSLIETLQKELGGIHFDAKENKMTQMELARTLRSNS